MSKSVIITGANGGLGTAVVKKFLDSGYKVIATVIHESMLDTFQKNENLEVHCVDLSKEDQATSFVKEMIAKHQGIDAALMLVGGFAMGNVEKTSGDDLLKMISLNFETAYFVARPLLSHMMQNNYGRLIFVGARPAIEAGAGKEMVAYSLSKSLIFKFAELLNAGAKGKNVSASVIVPSTIDTPANRKSMPDADFNKWVKTEQIADLIEMICSETGMPLRETVLKVYGDS